MDHPNPPAPETRLIVPWSTLLKVLLAYGLFLAIVKLWSFGIMLALALLVAVTLAPLLGWTQRRGWPRWAGILLCVVLLLVLVGGALGTFVPTFIEQGQQMIKKLPDFKAGVIARLPQSGGWRDSAQQVLDSGGFSNPEPLLKGFMEWGSAVADGLLRFFLLLVIAIYFLVDGPRVYRWLTAFLPEKHRRKCDEAAPEIVSVVGHYVAGQFILSSLFATYTFTALKFLHVPNAVVLALLAAMLDVLPLLGIAISSILAILMALTVSGSTAVWVAVLYLGYHMIENYFLLPKVYGDRLRLSALTILVSALAAVELLGFVGAILVLPIVASYPIIERIWLQPYLGRETVEKHDALDRQAEG